jgi:ABC-type thiamin/hydroxymethylpyrimidine transport system permease subunit
VTAEGALMIVVGLWLIAQVVAGQMLQRLGLFEGM